MIRLIIKIAIAVAFALLVSMGRAESVVNFAMTNRLTNLPDTNVFAIFSINDPVLAHGGTQTHGPALRVAPNTNGLASVTLLQGYYQMTNAWLGQGILFLVPGDTNAYNVNDIAVSGYNTYQVTGVRKLFSTNIFVSPVNGTGIVEIESTGGGGPGQFATSGTNSAGTTNGNVVTISGVTDTNVVKILATNSVIGAIQSIAIINTNSSVDPTNFNALVPFPAIGNSTNAERFIKILGLFESRNTAAQPITIISFGDSTQLYLQGATEALADTLALSYGNQEVQYDAPRNMFQSATLSGGATVNSPDTNYFGAYVTIHAGESYWETNFYAADGNFQIGAIDTYYILNPNGGTFQLQTNTGAGWGTIATLNSSGALAFTNTLTTITPGNFISTQYRYLGTSGTNYIVKPSGLITSVHTGTDKIRTLYVGAGGYDLSFTNLVGLLACNSNVQWTFWHAMQPDLVGFTMKHEWSLTGSNLWFFYHLITNAAPNAEVQFMATLPSVTDAASITGNASVRAFCVSNGLAYLDLCSQIPNGDTNWMANAGFYVADGGGIHPTLACWDFVLRPFYSLWGIRTGQPGTGGERIDRLSIGQVPAQDAAEVFSVGSKRSGGIFTVRPEDHNNIVDLGVRAGSTFTPVISMDGQTLVNFVNSIGGEKWFLNGTTYIGRTTPSGGWYFGAASPADKSVGTVTAESKLESGGLPFLPAAIIQGDLNVGNGTNLFLVDTNGLLTLTPMSSPGVKFNAAFLPNNAMDIRMADDVSVLRIAGCDVNGALMQLFGAQNPSFPGQIRFSTPSTGGDILFSPTGGPMLDISSNSIHGYGPLDLAFGKSYFGLVSSGAETNAAGSRVAYLNDISGAATNVINVAVNTNAVAVTNGTGLLVTISGVTDTNVVNILATNVAAYQSLIATNGLTTGAFTPSNTAWLNASNLSFQVTNGLTTGAFTSSNSAWLNSSNLAFQVTNGLTTGAFTSSNTAWVNASNLVQQATNAVVKQIQATNLLNGGSIPGQVATATATGVAWSNAPAGGGGPGLPGTNTIIAYGDFYRTNAIAISSGGVVISNNVGVVQDGSGGIWWTNLPSGDWGTITNDSISLSNRLTGITSSLTNGTLTMSNTTAAGIYSQLNATNLILSPGTAGAITLYAADGVTQIGQWTNGGVWASNPVSAPGFTNSGLLSAGVVGTDANGKLILGSGTIGGLTNNWASGNAAVLLSNYLQIDIAHSISASNATANRVGMIGPDHSITNAGANGAVPINADGSATTIAQVSALGTIGTATYVTGNALPLTNSFSGSNNWSHMGLGDTNDVTHNWQQLTNGGHFGTNAVTGNWFNITNDNMTMSNQVSGYYSWWTNGVLTMTNRTTANFGSQITTTNFNIYTGSNGSNTLWAANGTTPIDVHTNGGSYQLNPALSGGGFNLTTNAIPSSGILTAGLTYYTNLQASVTSGGIAGVPNNTTWELYIMATNSTASNTKYTFPNGCSGSLNGVTLGTPAAVTVTNTKSCLIRVWGYGQMQTNVMVFPNF